MDFKEVVVAIAWGPSFGLIISQIITKLICLAVWMRHYKKLGKWPAAEYFMMALGPFLKGMGFVLLLFCGEMITSEFFYVKHIYEHLFTQALIFVGLLAGSAYGLIAVKNFLKSFEEPQVHT